MKKTITENPGLIKKNKKQLEKELNVEINLKEDRLSLNGSGEDEFIAEEIINAINLDFSIKRALLLKNENNLFHIINIKDITHRKNLEPIKARIIGKQGRVLRNTSELTQCYISLKDNKIGIIGDAEEIQDAIQAITSLIQGSKHSNVYAKLEKRKKEKKLHPEDLEIERELRKKEKK